MMLVTREFKFDAAHFIEGYNGDCANMHGHTWRFAVSIYGNVNKDTGMIIDFKLIKSIITNKILTKLDHKILNNELDFNPTAENLAMWIYDEIAPLVAVGKTRLESVRLWENYPECYVEYFGG